MNKKIAIFTRSLAIAGLFFGSSLNLAAAEQGISSGHEAQRIEIRIENRQVVGEKVIRLTHEQPVELRWITDEAAELHIHGYDIRFEISPNAPADVNFTAHATGRYAVTSHGFGDEHGHGHETLVYLEVYPN